MRPITQHSAAERPDWNTSRIDAWHATFNAALTGILANSVLSHAGAHLSQAIETASQIANKTHGQIPEVAK